MTHPHLEGLNKLADDMNEWLCDPFVNLTPMRHMDVENFIGRLRTIANEALAAPPAEAPAERDLVERVALAIANVVGHGMAEKCEAQARAAILAMAAAPAGEVIGYARIRNGEVTQFSIMRDRDFGYTVPVIAAPAAPAEGCEICGGTRLVPQGVIGGKGYCKACKPPATGYTYGHCDEHKRAGGCQRHNLQCGYPDCDRRPIESPRVTGGREVEAHDALGHKKCRFCGWRGIPETAADPYTTDGTVEVCGGCNNAESFV